VSREMIALVRDHVVEHRAIVLYAETPGRVELWLDVGQDMTCVAILDSIAARILAEDLTKAAAYAETFPEAWRWRPSLPVWETAEEEC
jgi:hypothetical protein